MHGLPKQALHMALDFDLEARFLWFTKYVQ